MKRALLALILCAPLCFGLEQIIEPKERMTKNVLFLLDVSCSMGADDLTKAIGAVTQIATQNTDDLNVAVIAFEDDRTRWKGIPGTEPDGGPPEGWAAMPSQEGAKKLADWLDKLTGGGGTNLYDAMRDGMHVRQPRKGPLTVVVVTDDKIDAPQKAAMKGLVEGLQGYREKDGLGKAILVGYRIGKGDTESALRIIVEVGPVGGLFQED